jgi:hypothetical protein
LAGHADVTDKREVVGDSAYADGETRERLGNAGYTVRAKMPPARNRQGRFTNDRFHINLDDNTVTCPADQTVPITWSRRGGGKAAYASVTEMVAIRPHR